MFENLSYSHTLEERNRGQVTVYLLKGICQTTKHLNITKFWAHPWNVLKYTNFKFETVLHIDWFSYIYRTCWGPRSCGVTQRTTGVSLQRHSELSPKGGFHFKVSAPFYNARNNLAPNNSYLLKHYLKALLMIINISSKHYNMAFYVSEDIFKTLLKKLRTANSVHSC